MNPNDPTQGNGGSMPDPNTGGTPTGDTTQTPPAPSTPTEPAGEASQAPATGGESPTAGAPMQEEKCSTCGGAASGGNCTMCVQPTASCTCPPAQTGGGPAAPAM